MIINIYCRLLRLYYSVWSVWQRTYTSVWITWCYTIN